VPKSDDAISVYNGKGVSALDATTGALMETLERQIALRAELPTESASVRQLESARVAFVDPRKFTHQRRKTYSEDVCYLWTNAYDLIGNEHVKIPAAVAGFGPRYLRSGSPFIENSSTGLASGNCFEEAVCHGLCELIERDAFTMADLRSRWIPRALREAVFGTVVGGTGKDDVSACPIVDLRRAGQPIEELLERFEQAGLRPLVRDITSDLGICCVVASACDDSVQGFPQAHCGLGAHPNARIAVTRALTELAQSRATDIQGAREDIVAAGTAVPSTERHMQRIQKIEARRWLLQNAGPARWFSDLRSVQNEDISADINVILASLKNAGLTRVLVVQFDSPAPFSVVRTVVPGLEFWALEGGTVGWRAVEFWKRHLLEFQTAHEMR
jgi:ribosomal protein S12 methylthiotransferase accessory factor YcaO